MIFLGPNKFEIMFIILFGIKYCQNDISGFFRGNSDLNLHCAMICHVYAAVPNEAELIILGCLKLSWTDPPPVCVVSLGRLHGCFKLEGLDHSAILKKNLNRTLFLYILQNFRMCTIVIEALTPLTRTSHTKMYLNIARSSPFYRMAKKSIGIKCVECLCPMSYVRF